MNITQNTSYTDRDGVIDAVTRLVEGIDFGDEDLLRSAFTEDAVFDLSGVDSGFTPYVGREEAVRRLLDTVGLAMDTFHALTNIRVHIDGDTAQLTCYVLGQHHRLGHGRSIEYQDYFLVGNRFEVDLVRDRDSGWLIRQHLVSARWVNGNPLVAAIS